MVTKYYKYIPWLILGAIGSYESATYFGYSTFDKLYLSIVFYDCLRSFIHSTRKISEI